MSIYEFFSLENRVGSSEFIEGASGTFPWESAQKDTLKYDIEGSLGRYRSFLINILEENGWIPPPPESPIVLHGLSERVVYCILDLHFANKRLLGETTQN